MKALLLTITLLFSLLNISCSQQTRTVPTDDWTYVESVLADITSSATSNEVAQFKQLAETPGASVYFSDSPGYGSPMSVASLGSFAFFGKPELWVGDIAEVRVFFVDVHTTEGRRSALLLSIKAAGSESFETKAFIGTRASEVQGGEFVAILGDTSGNEVLTLRTDYVDEDNELEGVIRLDVSEFDSNGLETYIGQFSTMVGFQSF